VVSLSKREGIRMSDRKADLTASKKWYLQEKAEDKVRDLLEYFGESVATDDIIDTPKRFVKAYQELLRGNHEKIPKLTTFESDYDQMVVVTHIECVSLCVHHVLPILLDASVGYVPDKRIVGISKIPRLVKWCCARLTTQEELTGWIAQLLEDKLKPLGVMVVLKGRHLCMEIRGVKTRAPVVTSAIRGIFKQPEKYSFKGIAPVQEFLRHCQEAGKE